MFAYDYPMLGMFFTIMLFFFWIVWIVLLFRVIGDLFRRDDVGGLVKTGWLILVIIIPYLGVFIYLIANGHGMVNRDQSNAQAKDDAMRAYVQQTVGTSSSTDQLAKLADLKEPGAITDAEYEQQKAKLLA